MADEIVNKLGFDVQQALTALQQLDSRLQTSGAAFQAHAAQLNAWNTQAQAALATMRAMASAAGQVQLPAVPTAAAAAATPAAQPSLWLPPGVANQAAQATQSMNNLATASTNAGQQMQQAGQQGGQALQGAGSHAKSLVTSIQMMGRIIVTQTIVRALSAIRNAFREAVASSIEFQRSVSEVLMLTLDDLGQTVTATFQTLSDEAAEFSKSFNIPLPQVAEGLYQTISNQFVETSERARVMESSMKLARIGVMDLKDSVLLITGVLNAYGMSSENSEIAAAKLFRTIQLGRVRGKELADTLGTVIPIAAQLGVSLDEVTAAYTSMTIGGINAHKTSTALRQAMLAFLKPSEDMKKVLREMGYANAEQILQAEGFIGALKSVSEASKGMATEIGKSFRRVRGLTAALALTREDAEAYQKAIEAMSETSSESLDRLYEKFKEMPAEKLTANINKLKVTMTRDFGAMLTGLLGNIMEFVGGADRLAAALQAIAVVCAVAGAALALLAIKALLAQAALGPVGIALMAISAIIAAGVYETAMEIAAIRETAQARREAAQEEIRALEEAQRKRREVLEEQLQEENRAWEKGVAQIRRQYFKAIDDLKVKNQELIDNTKQTMASMVDSQSRVVAAYRNAAKAAMDAVTASRARQITAEAAYSDAVFEYAHRNERAYEKAERYMGRAASLAREAEEAMRAAKTPEDIAAAQAIFQRADAAAQEAESIAGSTKSVMLQEDAQRTVLWVMRQKISAEEALQEIQAREAERLAARAAEEQGRLDEMKSLTKAILEDLQAFDKTGAREPKALKAQQERLEKAVARLRELWLGGKEVNLADMIAFDKLQQRIQLAVEGGVKDVEVKKIFALPETFADFKSQIEDGVGPIKVLIETAIPKLPPDVREMISEATAEEAVGVLSAQMAETVNIISEYRTMGDSLSTANRTIQLSMDAARKGMDQWIQREFLLEDVGDLAFWGMPLGFYQDTKAAVEAFRDQINKFTKMPPAALDESDFQALQDAYKQYIETVKPTKASKALLDEFIRDAAAAASEAERAAKLREGLAKIEEKAAEAERARPALQQALEAAQRAAAAVEQAARPAAEAAERARDGVAAAAQVDMSGLAAQTAAAADAMWDLAYASMAVQTPAAPEIAARGGRVGRYLAAGGPVGTDVVPAWLTRGEFVMNAQASRRFASQLVAMNAGVQPNFRSEGGSVTNIGDINVTVSGGATGRQTARSIARELRRELRRGTTTL
jgi:TP901 family phage tail tape measure protein